MVDINNGDEPGTGTCSVQVEVDLGIWMKTMEVKYGMERVVLRQGLLHLGMCFLSIPAKRYCVAGLKDLFIEAETALKYIINSLLHYKD